MTTLEQDVTTSKGTVMNDRLATVPEFESSYPTSSNSNNSTSKPVASMPNTTGQELKNRQRLSTTPKMTDSTTDDSVPDPASPNKGTLKVTNYGLRKGHHKKRSYKCQNCGKCENSVRELNEHHWWSHPPLLCSDCNKIFYGPFYISTASLRTPKG